MTTADSLYLHDLNGISGQLYSFHKIMKRQPEGCGVNIGMDTHLGEIHQLLIENHSDRMILVTQHTKGGNAAGSDT